MLKMYLGKLIVSYHVLLLTSICILLVSVAVKEVYAHGEITTEPVKLDVATFPPMVEDIQALSKFSLGAKEAGIRLIERGDEILTIAHGVLADVNAPYEQRLQLLYVLGEVGSSDSITEIIHSIEDMPNNRYLYQNALLALSNFEPTDEIITFVNKQLDVTKRDPLIQRSALNYYAKQPDENVNQWVEKYALNNDANPEVRYAALYMAGMNGVDTIKQPVKDVLDATTNTIREYYLLLGFAGVATLEEFNALVNEKGLNIDNVNKVREFLMFRLANLEEKKKLAPDFLTSNNTQLKQVVVDHLIEEQDADTLANSWQRGDGLVRSAVKRAGYSISVNDQGASFEVSENNKDSLLWVIVITLSILLGVFLLLRFMYHERQAS